MTVASEQSPPGPRIRAGALEGILAPLKRKNIDVDRLLDEVGIGRGPFDVDDSLSLNDYATFLSRASEQSGEPCLGVYLATQFPKGGTGVLGYLLLNAPNVRRSVECLIRYVRIQVDAVEIDYSEEHGIGWLTFTYTQELDAPRRVLTEFAFALLILRMRALVGSEWTPLAVEFENREPECADEYAQIFGQRIAYDRPSNRIAISANTLYRRIPEADARLFQILCKVADRERDEVRDSVDIIVRTRRAIAEMLGQGKVDLETMAGALELQPRQLQWRLSQHGTTFEAELGLMRQRMAARYLTETDESVTDIAFMLGFSEVSAFTRAAHRWFGMSPSSYRASIR